MVSRYEDFIRDIVITIHMNLHELDERQSFADPEELCHIEGKLMAYREVVAILKTSAQEFKMPSEELGL